ncbi:DEKNAAC103508 [Brettanomyces naardenensis]|uniref:DEKNAAC103508 n=1 Tax=Brettanomyces naardenensis TaxID=13370 RepID=A0A448YP42_BRENA|nr:DEKNAAC103508 [Brettanomyces naardenensis]
MSSPALHIVKPNIVVPLGSSADTPIKVTIESSTLLQLIETIYENNDSTPTQTRTVGTLLGTRSDDGSNIEVKECYIVPHKEEDEELTIEEAFHISAFHLYKRANQELQVIGWFSTSPELDAYTGLFHEFYAKGSCAPYQPVLLTLQYRDNDSGEIISPIVKTYISSPVGLPPNSGIVRKLNLEKIGSYAFVPIPNEVTYSKNELTTLKYLSEASKKEDRSFDLKGLDELKQMSSTVNQISDLIKILQDYTERAAKGEIEGDNRIGQLLLSNLNYKLSEVDVDDFKKDFETHVNDTMLLQYLASCIKQQLDLSAKLTNFITPEDAVAD